MSAVFPLLVSSLGLAGIFFMLSSGLSLIYGLMRVLNLAHGSVFAFGAYAGWVVMQYLPVDPLELRFTLALLSALVTGGLLGLAMERLLLARFYGRSHVQMLITLGLSFALVAYLVGTFGHDPLPLVQPAWFNEVTVLANSRIPNSRLVIVGISILVLAATVLFIRRSKHGLIIRAGVENRQMVSALGTDVSRSFTLLFVLGSALAGLGGILAALFFGGVVPSLGTSQLIFAFTVVIIGGLGSIEGTALAALIVAVLQQFFNYYGPPGAGDLIVVLGLAVMILFRPKGLLGKVSVSS
jgi:branched-chain amino acid transport system permease protein